MVVYPAIFKTFPVPWREQFSYCANDVDSLRTNSSAQSGYSGLFNCGFGFNAMCTGVGWALHCGHNTHINKLTMYKYLILTICWNLCAYATIPLDQYIQSKWFQQKNMGTSSSTPVHVGKVLRLWQNGSTRMYALSVTATNSLNDCKLHLVNTEVCSKLNSSFTIHTPSTAPLLTLAYTTR